MKPLIRSLMILAVLVLAALACRQPGAGDSTDTPDVTPSPVLFQDNFSDASSGWNRVSQPDGETNYADGVYRILVNTPNTDIWTRPSLSFTDVRIEVDALKVGGDRDNRFGVICRVTGESSFYTFIISSDGYYGIGKIRGDDYELIGTNALQPSEKIQQGSTLNHIRADCVGSMLTLYVNGEKIAEAQDEEFTAGDVGLIAGTYENPGTDIRFDNFTVMRP